MDDEALRDHGPEAETIDRVPSPHVAFAAGSHYCRGASLARLHGEVAIGLLLAPLPGQRADGDPAWLGSIPVRNPCRRPWRGTTEHRVAGPPVTVGTSA
jgi:cytochrome P450